MQTKSFLIGLAALAFLATVLPTAAHADSWRFSPYAAQIASDQSGQAPEDEAVPPADVSGKKNVGRGVMFSLVIPGTGQLYSGSWLRALPWFAIEVTSWALFSSYHGQGNDKTDEFEAYAGPQYNTDPAQGHFNYDVYMLREYQIATNPAINETTTPYDKSFEEWKDEEWEERGGEPGRSTFLPPPFGHNINTPDLQQYYEMIGKYFTQFGFGWNDTYNTPLPITGSEGDIWSTTSGDDPATLAFDGNSAFFYHYRDMRGEANDWLDKGNVMMEIVLANHVLSALDAAFAVRSYNRKLADGRLGLRYEPKAINGDLARMMTLSFDLR